MKYYVFIVLHVLQGIAAASFHVIECKVEKIEGQLYPWVYKVSYISLEGEPQENMVIIFNEKVLDAEKKDLYSLDSRKNAIGMLEEAARNKKSVLIGGLHGIPQFKKGDSIQVLVASNCRVMSMKRRPKNSKVIVLYANHGWNPFKR